MMLLTDDESLQGLWARFHPSSQKIGWFFPSNHRGRTIASDLFTYVSLRMEDNINDVSSLLSAA